MTKKSPQTREIRHFVVFWDVKENLNKILLKLDRRKRRFEGVVWLSV